MFSSKSTELLKINVSLELVSRTDAKTSEMLEELKEDLPDGVSVLAVVDENIEADRKGQRGQGAEHLELLKRSNLSFVAIIRPILSKLAGMRSLPENSQARTRFLPFSI